MTEFTARYLANYRAPSFAISTIDLTFELSNSQTRVTSVMAITSLANSPTTLILDGEQLTLISVQLNDEFLSAQDYVLTENTLEIATQETSFTLTIVTEIDPQNNTSLEGLFKSGDAYCTQCEAEGFRRITYYLDRPDVMAIFTTKIIAHKRQYPYLLSNGNNIAQGDLADGQHFVTWHDPYPKPCYLFALVAGDFDLLTDSFQTSSHRNVALEIFVDKGNILKATHAMQSLKRAMRWDEEVFGLEYDLDIYMIVAVDFFNMGAMENKGLNVFNSKFVLADAKTATDSDYFNVEAVIAHEYFHNWTGNRVTCRDWFQLSLKEGLTVFRDQQFSADMHSAAVTRIQNVRVLRSLQFAEDAGPMAHAIRPEKVVEMNNFYTLTVYEKGAEVIRMLHTLLGADKFRQGMDLYFNRFDGMAVTCDDFIDAMADASGVDLSQFKRWYQQAGTPMLVVDETFDPVSNKYVLTVSQQHTPTSSQKEKVNLHIPIYVELLAPDTGESHQHLLELTDDSQEWEFDHFVDKPVVAFLGDFTAPVKVNFFQNDEELKFIMVHAQDAFSRWDAGQKLLITYIKSLVKDPALPIPQSLLAAFAELLVTDIDPALKAEQLTLPTFDEIADAIVEVDPVLLVNAISQLQSFLALGLSTELLAEYHKNCQISYQNDGVSQGKRALRNVCLSYLAVVPSAQELVAQQYQLADNMTDTLAALTGSAKNNLLLFTEQQQHFEQIWQDTPLVLDKWFMINAYLNSDDIFERLADLLNHPKFSLKNPNRARSLIGAFASGNPKYFHCISGRGYRFLAQQIAQLNAINPQVAARLITPLIQFKGFDKVRQQLMRTELENLAKIPNLCKDLQEKLAAALR